MIGTILLIGFVAFVIILLIGFIAFVIINLYVFVIAPTIAQHNFYSVYPHKFNYILPTGKAPTLEAICAAYNASWANWTKVFPQYSHYGTEIVKAGSLNTCYNQTENFSVYLTD